MGIEADKINSKPYVFFISHSTEDLKTDVEVVCDIFNNCKIPSYIADRDAPVGKPLQNEIMKAIEESEIFLVFITENSIKSPWVNQEIGYALGKNIPILPLKKGEVRIIGLIEAAKYILMTDNPLDTVENIFKNLEKNKLSRIAQAVIFAILGLLKIQKMRELKK